ncbi:FG-GAP repeat protein [Engelhardtia mirabilis]|uniref:FG-GAP repeat protein n=1 Tax=Engelhardtia mirabilis TaxID=2528011 RepID=A0A518BGE6_9BACT|nr:hypothetical protein Pla133_11330 [Planctomycetes bacterium Pla133]QDV00394.1 hypothetical protein Pla86_11330 [Planctomycetes bacterium Pla86]
MVLSSRLIPLIALPALAAAQAQQCLPTDVLDPDGTNLNDDFGFGVAVDGARAFVGAPGDQNLQGTSSGAAYLIDLVSGEVELVLSIFGAQTGDRFGESVDICGPRAVVGTKWGGATSFIGAAHLYDLEAGTKIAKLSAIAPVVVDHGFGRVVAITPTRVLVARPLDSVPGGACGAVDVFDALTGAPLQTLLPDDPGGLGALGQFGSAMAVDGELVVIGAPRDGSQGVAEAGAAYVFDLTTGQRLTKLFPPAPGAGDRFGTSVAIEGGLVAVGAPLADVVFPDTGRAWTFDAATGAPLAELIRPGADAGEEFGTAVGITAGVALVGAPKAYGYRGVVQRFDAVTGAAADALVPCDSDGGDRVGSAISTCSSTVVVSAPTGGPGPGTGVLHEFALDLGHWSSLGSGLAGISGVPSLSGTGALEPECLVQLVVSNAAPSAPAVLVLGSSALSLALLGGQLIPSPDAVVAGLVTEPDGTLELGFQLVSAIPSGLDLYVQAWVLDAGGPQGFAATAGLTATAP